MAVTQSAAFSSSLSFIETTTYGDQTQTEQYFLNDSASIPTGTAGTPTNWFNGYAKSTGTIASGATLNVSFISVPHQAITGGEVNRNFTHINAFYFESTSATGVDDKFIIRATGTDAFTNLFYGGSGDHNGQPVRAYAPFNYVDYYGTDVAVSNRALTIYNAGYLGGPAGLDYKYMVVGATG
tara:strand:- start:45 stop:590 length:546 start_codon:yes stop_codon:yes gene_type:complete